MLIRHFMTRSVVSFEEDLLCTEAWRLLRRERVRRAPVVRGSRVVGIVTDRDLMRVLPWTIGDLERAGADQALRQRVDAACTKNPISISPNQHIEEAAALMLEHKIGGLPVLEDRELVGMITESDIFRIIASPGRHAGDTRLTLEWSSEDAQPDPVRVCLAAGVQLLELARYVSPGGEHMIVLCLQGTQNDPAVKRLADLGFIVIEHPR